MTAIEVFEISVDGCKHYANERGHAAAQNLARWCHDRGYCYHRSGGRTYVQPVLFELLEASA